LLRNGAEVQRITTVIEQTYHNSELDLQPLLQKIAAQYRLDPMATHGVAHWGRVLENGLTLAEQTGADRRVVYLFAIFHDACRRNESIDPRHGKRGADFAKQLLSETHVVTPNQLDLLVEACTRHTDGRTRANITVQTCWDADRLDLARAGIYPSARRLCTKPAKDAAMIEWASERALGGVVPDFVETEWMPIFEAGTQYSSRYL
jgi:uncharacterized protein